MKCPNCHKDIRSDSNFCEYCGFKCKKLEGYLNVDKKDKLNSWIVALITLFVIIILCFVCNKPKIPNVTKTVSSEEKVEIPKDETIESSIQDSKTSITSGLDKINLISKGFGYTRFGEPAVVGKVKNNNNRALYIRADINLLDNYGNVIGDTYTYDKVQAYSIWDFEAPTFGINASDMDVHLSIDEV